MLTGARLSKCSSRGSRYEVRQERRCHIAYQVIGEGPIDLVFLPGWITHIELGWDDPRQSRFLHRLASFSRLIIFDKRGSACLTAFLRTNSRSSGSEWMTFGR